MPRGAGDSDRLAKGCCGFFEGLTAERWKERLLGLMGALSGPTRPTRPTAAPTPTPGGGESAASPPGGETGGRSAISTAGGDGVEFELGLERGAGMLMARRAPRGSSKLLHN